MSRRAAALLALLALLLACAAPAGAQEPKTTLNDVEDEVMCDVCQVPLNTADAPRATQQREEIQQLIDRGLTKEQILDTLEDRYGPTILATPADEGFGLAAYLVPLLAIGGVLALLLVLVPRWRRRTPPAPAPAAGPEISAADARRLQRDLDEYDP